MQLIVEQCYGPKHSLFDSKEHNILSDENSWLCNGIFYLRFCLVCANVSVDILFNPG